MPTTSGEPRPPEVVRAERRTMALAGVVATLLTVFAVRYATDGHWVSAAVLVALAAGNAALVVTLARRARARRSAEQASRRLRGPDRR